MSYTVKNHKLSSGGSNVEFIRSPNIGGEIEPQFLIIHFTASGPGNNIARYFAKPSAEVSAHLVIDRSGHITQCVPFNIKGWHAGKSTWTDRTGQKHSGLNSTSIGIELENWGPLSKTGTGWLSWTGVPVDPGFVVQARHKFGGPVIGWETFTQPQIDACVAASKAICSAYGIEEILGHDDISPGRKSDPGPAWSMADFQTRVTGDADEDAAIWRVRSPNGLNIRSGPGAEHPKVQPDALPDGTPVLVHEQDGNWRYVSVLNDNGDPDFSGWVHGLWLRAA